MISVQKIVGVLASNIQSKNGKKKKVKKSPPCHEGNVYVFTIGKVRIYGGGRNRDFKPDEVDILIPTLEGYENSLSWRAAELFPRFAAARHRQVVIPIITKDFNAPTLSLLEWYALVDDLKNIDRPMKALVFCVGGHGRTGTVLSILYGLTHPEKGDPVERIRELYCKKAVESCSQLDYVEDMTGIDVKATPSKSYAVSSKSKYKGYYSTNYYGRGTAKQISYLDMPKQDELIANTAWANKQKEMEWKDSHRYNGYEYTFINHNQYYRLKE